MARMFSKVEPREFQMRQTTYGPAFVFTPELIEDVLWACASNFKSTEYIRKLIIDQDTGDLLVLTNDPSPRETSALMELSLGA